MMIYLINEGNFDFLLCRKDALAGDRTMRNSTVRDDKYTSHASAILVRYPRKKEYPQISIIDIVKHVLPTPRAGA